MDSKCQRAVQVALAHDDASSNIELVEYLVQDVGITLSEAWDSVLHRLKKVEATPQKPYANFA